MLTINTNLSSLIAQNSLKTSTNKLNLAIERMTTGYKINHSKDNAANYSIVTNMNSKISSYMVAEDNCAMGLDMLTTATESLDLIYDKLTRLRDLAEQSSNGTYGEQSLKAINSEANALVDEIERLYNNTEYNGINLMKGQVSDVEESKFIKDIDRRETKWMKKLSDVDISEELTEGSYSISTADELAKLATMTKNGLIGKGTEFVLANDIDLQQWCDDNIATGGWVPIGIAGTDNPTLNPDGNAKNFSATFDGNGYVISNLKINRSDHIYQALFGCANGATIKNLGIEDAALNGKSYTAALVGFCAKSIVSNCWTSGTIAAIGAFNAGIVATGAKIDLTDCYSEVICTSGTMFSGIVGYLYRLSDYSNTSSLNNCHVYGNSPIISHIFTQVRSGIANLNNCVYTANYSAIGLDNTALNADATVNIENVSISEKDALSLGKLFISNSICNLQVGTNSDANSRIGVDTGYALDGLSILRKIGSGTGDYLSQVDFLLNNLNTKQTEIGSAQNRLESALTEIETQYSNLVSSRSTLRDADIAEVSSQYIQQQILQQASATLLATANQTPGIALQLI